MYFKGIQPRQASPETLKKAEIMKKLLTKKYTRDTTYQTQ
jgi:hypothetical protein